METKNYDQVREKNLKINETFKEVIELMKKNKVKTFNENGEMRSEIRNILQLELEKCIKLYCFEYGFELPTEKISVYEAREEDGQINLRPELNARGDTDGVKVYAGLQNGLDNILSKAGLEGKKLDDGKIHATKVYGENIVETKTSGKNYKSSHRDQLDLFAELLINEKIDLDFILDVFPHEAMHIFIPGKGVFVEGTTELLAREAADKYGLRLSPTSHSKETAIISRLEGIVGKDSIASIALTNAQKDIRKTNKDEINSVRFNLLRKEIDNRMGEGKFDEIKSKLDSEYDEFLKCRTKSDEFQKYRGQFFNTTINELDNWMEKNPNKLQVLNNDKDITDGQKEEIFKIQQKEKELLEKVRSQFQQKYDNIEIEER